jgi:hypothetical protein
LGKDASPGTHQNTNRHDCEKKRFHTPPECENKSSGSLIESGFCRASRQPVFSYVSRPANVLPKLLLNMAIRARMIAISRPVFDKVAQIYLPELTGRLLMREPLKSSYFFSS